MTFDLSSMDPNHYDRYILHKPQNVRASEALNKAYILNKIHPASPSIQPFKIGTSTASTSLRSAWHNTIFTLSQSDMVKSPNHQKKLDLVHHLHFFFCFEVDQQCCNRRQVTHGHLHQKKVATSGGPCATSA